MPSATSQITIINRGLQILGAKSVGLITDNDRGARAMNRAYLPVLYAMLRENYWNFAIKRASLSASTTPPAFGPANYFPLPGDFLDLAPDDQNFGTNCSGFAGNAPYNDYQIEGNMIASNMQSPLLIRYVSSNVLESQMDSCFAEAFSARLAVMCCEELTQSNSKLQAAAKIYSDQMDMAKSRGAFEGRPQKSPIDPWILARY